MALLQELADIAPRKVNVCAVSRLLDSLSFDERELLSKLIDDPEIAISDIISTLLRNELRISDSVVRKHRRRRGTGGCACP